LRFDLLQFGGVAQASYVRVFRLLAENLLDPRLCFIAAKSEIQFFIPIQADDVREKADLSLRPVAVGAVDLAVNVPRVDEQNFDFPWGLPFAAV
jgi:hypothetical protein